MRGGWLHNHMVARLTDVLRRAGAWVRLEEKELGEQGEREPSMRL